MRGIVGAVVGLIPILFIGAWALGLIAFILGIVGWRSVPRRKLARAATVLGAVAIALGVLGVVIVSDAFDDLESDLECIADADSPEELEAC